MPIIANNCVVLGIDPGQSAGWALFHQHNYIASGTAKTAVDRACAVRRAWDLADVWGIPLIVGRESWTAGSWRSHKTLLGMGAAWGRWEDVLERYDVPARYILTVTPNTWRSKILGLAPGRHTREQAKESALAYCRARWPKSAVSGHDESDAICIAYFFAFDDRVAKAINPRTSKKAQASRNRHKKTTCQCKKK